MPSPHPHPRPDRRYRLDLHRHLWDARRADELRTRAALLPDERGWAVDRWSDEAAILLDAEGSTAGTVDVRLGGGKRLIVQVDADAEQRAASIQRLAASLARPAAGTGQRRVGQLLLLPDAATWTLPDQELLRAGLIAVDQLHPLVAAALVPDRPPAASHPPPGVESQVRPVRCRGAWHRIGVVDAVLTPLDHDPTELHREELLAALTGTPLPCLRAVDQAHRHPECLPDVRARLDHGDLAGALATVQALLGPDALLRNGALRDELETAALRRVTYGLYRTGLAGLVPFGPRRRQPADHRAHQHRPSNR